jgi:AcrR family transcriptional regulator
MPLRSRAVSALASAKKRVARVGVHQRGIDDTRAELLAAARDVFLEAGPAQFSLREVARRVGVSAAAVYRHFEGKEALVQAACTQGFQVFSSYLVRALVESTPRARLLAMSEQYRLFGLENPLDYRFIFMSSTDELSKAAASDTHARAAPLPQDTTFLFLVDRVRECVEAGVLAPGDPEVTAVQIWAHVHGLVALRLSHHLQAFGDDAAFAEFYRASVNRLLRGFAA